MAERCPKSDLLVDQCGHCRAQQRKLKPEFPARYAGHCPTCGTGFHADALIRELPTGEYEHARHARPINPAVG